ncbi:hypothetical protein [Sphingobacterium kyonggiense]
MLRVIQRVDIQPKVLTSGIIGVDDWHLKNEVRTERSLLILKLKK